MPELVGADDSTVLAGASAAGRCLVTENFRDFAVLARQAHHTGVLFAHPGRWPRIRSGVPRLAGALHQALYEGSIPDRNDTAWLT